MVHDSFTNHLNTLASSLKAKQSIQSEQAEHANSLTQMPKIKNKLINQQMKYQPGEHCMDDDPHSKRREGKKKKKLSIGSAIMRNEDRKNKSGREHHQCE